MTEGRPDPQPGTLGSTPQSADLAQGAGEDLHGTAREVHEAGQQDTAEDAGPTPGGG